nr:MAG TPA: Kita-kyushu lung cancer antigen 1 [Caudoviricetes sp.]
MHSKKSQIYITIMTDNLRSLSFSSISRDIFSHFPRGSSLILSDIRLRRLT